VDSASGVRSSYCKNVCAPEVRELGMADDRVERYAELLVSRCIDPRPGWQVLVTGTSEARPLLERLSAALARRDAYAIRRISFGEPFGIDAAWVNAAPAALAPTLAPLERDLIDHVDGKIFVLAPESEYPLAHLSFEAMAAASSFSARVCRGLRLAIPRNQGNSLAGTSESPLLNASKISRRS
jgi:leucyl aminopeptidase (aminopeptidase T)